jgi:putative ABC transport system permease protein
MALGAGRRRVLTLIVREGALLAFGGLVIGLAAALVLSRALRSMLFQVTTTDPWTYGLMGLVLASAAFLASWLPARRAAGVDPVVALRNG